MVKMIIGLDPGVTTGMCLFDPTDNRVLEVRTFDFWEAYSCLATYNIKTCRVVIEAPVKTAMYGRQEANAEKGGKGYGNRMMANAASNAREAELLADGLERLGFEVKRVRPIRRGKDKDGNKLGKITPAELKEETGYEDRTNQHVRDAIMLVWKNRS